jgi:hypothetical protein
LTLYLPPFCDIWEHRVDTSACRPK